MISSSSAKLESRLFPRGERNRFKRAYESTNHTRILEPPARTIEFLINRIMENSNSIEGTLDCITLHKGCRDEADREGKRITTRRSSSSECYVWLWRGGEYQVTALKETETHLIESIESPSASGFGFSSCGRAVSVLCATSLDWHHYIHLLITRWYPCSLLQKLDISFILSSVVFLVEFHFLWECICCQFNQSGYAIDINRYCWRVSARIKNSCLTTRVQSKEGSNFLLNSS